jgi:hypothetical protein
MSYLVLGKYIPGGRHVGCRGGPDEAVVQGGVGRIRAVRVLETRFSLGIGKMTLAA